MSRDWAHDAILSNPPNVAPKESWWAKPGVQHDRAAFNEWARAEQHRIVGNRRFGGGSRTHDKFPSAPKKSQR